MDLYFLGIFSVRIKSHVRRLLRRLKESEQGSLVSMSSVRTRCRHLAS
jgi:hypothetical protein